MYNAHASKPLSFRNDSAAGGAATDDDNTKSFEFSGEVSELPLPCCLYLDTPRFVSPRGGRHGVDMK